jgi:tetratricopeptide (TPR) repeat protein
VFAQEAGNPPKITQIPGGYFVEWQSLTDIAAVQLDKKLSGAFEMMFDVPAVEFINRKPAPVSTPEMIVPLADYWIVRGKPERAIPLYEKGLEKEPESILFQNNLAMLYSQTLGQHERGLNVVNKALASQKDNISLLDTKGLILLNSKNAPEAVPVLERAVELSCQNPTYCMHLAYALYLDGRDGQARRYFDPVRDQLSAAAPNMVKENKAMFDLLKLKLPAENKPQ